jgi:phosphatidylinositol alpha-mannosyltransferase
MARLPTLLERGSKGGRQLRVAIVSPYAWDRFGGVQSHIAALTETLLQRGHEAKIFAPVSMSRSLKPADEPHFHLVGRAVGIPANGSIAPLAFGPLAATGIRTALRDFAPDVLHLHEPLIPSLSLLAALNSDVPAVGTFHASAEGSFGYRAAKLPLERAMRKIKVRTVVSDAARELIARYFPGDYVLTPNGVEVERFATAEPIVVEEGRTVLFFGRIERRKGLEVLIQAMARLSDLEATLVVAGGGPEEKHCRNLAATLEVRVRFIGRVPDEDKPGIYRGADVYCAPGLGGESFGIVLVEALAAGTPVVCSDLDGYRAVAGEVAELVPPGDAGLLADAIRSVLVDDPKAEQMRQLSRKMAGLYDWKRLAAGVEANYEAAIAAG